MTSRRKNLIALVIFMLGFIAIPMLTLINDGPQWCVVTSMLLTGISFAFWALCFSCPRCGTPFLWEIRNHTKVARLFPLKVCAQCGLPTNKPFKA